MYNANEIFNAIKCDGSCFFMKFDRGIQNIQRMQEEPHEFNVTTYKL